MRQVRTSGARWVGESITSVQGDGQTTACGHYGDTVDPAGPGSFPLLPWLKHHFGALAAGLQLPGIFNAVEGEAVGDEFV